MRRIFKNIAALALMIGALIGSVGTSDAQNYRYYNNAYGSGPALRLSFSPRYGAYAFSAWLLHKLVQ